MNDTIDNFGKRSKEVTGCNFRVKENLWGEEAFKADVDAVLPTGYAMFSFKASKVLVWIGIILAELFDDILAYVTIVLLDLLSDA